MLQETLEALRHEYSPATATQCERRRRRRVCFATALTRARCVAARTNSKTSRATGRSSCLVRGRRVVDRRSFSRAHAARWCCVATKRWSTKLRRSVWRWPVRTTKRKGGRRLRDARHAQRWKTPRWPTCARRTRRSCAVDSRAWSSSHTGAACALDCRRSRPVRASSASSRCLSRARVHALAHSRDPHARAALGISARHFGQNLQKNYLDHAPHDPQLNPDQVSFGASCRFVASFIANRRSWRRNICARRRQFRATRLSGALIVARVR